MVVAILQYTIFSNKIINAAFVSWLLAQLIKFVIIFISTRKIDISRLYGSGGMPSSHASTVMTLLTCVIRIEGFESVNTAISALFAFIVMYDATGVRRAAGKQAEILNIIIENWSINNNKLVGLKLKELIGHTPVQVFFGAALGILIGIVMPV